MKANIAELPSYVPLTGSLGVVLRSFFLEIPRNLLNLFQLHEVVLNSDLVNAAVAHCQECGPHFD